jgi:hypothetical protein
MSASGFCAAAMYTAVVLSRKYLDLGASTLSQLLALVMVGIISYALLSATLNRRIFREIIELRNR